MTTALTTIGEVLIDADHVAILGPAQDDEGHAETLAWWLAPRPFQYPENEE